MANTFARICWCVLALFLFVSFWFIPTGSYKFPYFGSDWIALFRGDYGSRWKDALLRQASQAVFVAIIAIVVAWVVTRLFYCFKRSRDDHVAK